MKTALFFLLTISAYAADTIEVFGHKWSVFNAADWKIEPEKSAQTLHLTVKRPQEKPRRPIQFALAETQPFEKVTLEADVKREGGSLILVYAYVDEAHFNYAHLSVDAPSKQPVHNGIFHVFGGDRVRISATKGPGSLPSAAEWYKVRLKYDGTTGVVNVLVNGQEFPSLKGVDLSLGAGKVGIGSFFETGSFRNVKITGTPASN